MFDAAARYRFMGHFVGEPEPREVPERLIAGFYQNHIHEHGGDLSWPEFCEEISDPHGALASSKGDFWAEKKGNKHDVHVL